SWPRCRPCQAVPECFAASAGARPLARKWLMASRRINPLRSFWRLVCFVVWVFAANAVGRADEARIQIDSEQFPQSATIVRDRQIEAVLDAARAQLAKGEHAAAIATLQ